MATTTPNFGWPVPTSTDLVKDGATAIEALGDGIDASLVDLKGGLTGQVLAKTTNTDMDFTWVTTDDANAIQNAIVNAKGDIIGASANDVPAITSVGANGEYLVADSTTSTGLRYQGNYAAGKNRVINGSMVIDQRNSAASAVTVNTAASNYAVDRWLGFGQATDGVFTLGQDSSVPAGFSKSLKATVTTADASIGSTQIYVVSQNIEGLQVADFDFGLAMAKTITLSFWVRSSLTGTFGGALRNGNADRSYPFTYSISVADTWEKKTITVAGDTTGTWLKDTGIGLRLSFALGAGTDRTGTAGAWNGNNNAGATGQTQVISTLNATWYVTGVQVEIGNVATAFQTATGTIQGELSAAQRYYQRFGGQAAYQVLGTGMTNTSTNVYGLFSLPVPMRVIPTSVDYSTLTYQQSDGGLFTISSAAFNSTGLQCVRLDLGITGGTANRPGQILTNNSTSAYVGFNAEL